MKWLAIAAIRLYQWSRKGKAPRCLHHPSCSNYGVLALRKYPLVQALRMTHARYADCNIFTERPYVDFP